MGEQYALPEAVDALRRARRDDRPELVVRISATDPLNLVGILIPGPRIPAHAGAWVVLRDGAFDASAVASPGGAPSSDAHDVDGLRAAPVAV
jgi:ATP-dependent Lhr-like helicase